MRRVDRVASFVRAKVSDEGGDDALVAEWEHRGMAVPLVVIESPCRETVRRVRPVRPPAVTVTGVRWRSRAEAPV